MRRSLALSLSLVVLGCGEPAAPSAPTPSAPTASDEPLQPEARSSSDEAALASANAAADSLASTLRARLMQAMLEDGPAGAMRVCSVEAQTIATDVAAERGAAVGRSSLRLRNPADAPPPWVREWLEASGERPAAGVAGLARVEDGHARVLRPIAIEHTCLVCHGPAETLAPEITALLRERYPDDRATGYALGDLRGALWAEVAVSPRSQ